MEYKGELKGFPKPIVEKMLERQVEQGNKKNVSVFERNVMYCVKANGFSWDKTKEGYKFWEEVIHERNFDFFFEKYPKDVLSLELDEDEEFLFL